MILISSFCFADKRKFFREESNQYSTSSVLSAIKH